MIPYARTVSDPQADQQPERTHRISVVTPVYKGEHTLPGLAQEMTALMGEQVTPDGHRWVLTEWLLVHDNGPDASADTMAALAREHDFVRPIWLSRNYGQHPATLAGMASSSGDWIVTLDEDGQHNPADIGRFLDVALNENAQLVYAAPTNEPPHGALRNLASKGAKWVFASFLAGGAVQTFQSYRLVLGELGRSVAAYAGAGVYLDVALGWVVDRISHVDVELREEGGRPSGYSLRRLLSHFWRLVLSSGTRGLRVVSGLGVVFGLAGILFAIYLVISVSLGRRTPEGWTSNMVVVLLSTGAILFSLGVIAEYIGVAVGMAMGKPPYLIISDPGNGPLGRRPGSRSIPR
ncbi:glycosyltransferase involved in cell wall biosynthesis [Humibacillus xanthopallidus]|uniref:Glycosyltransferase involved in cell wall biosynthesis n=1 Tax=Humibacillus xanthopallidus TaxID=412689 RepID=A0A543I095_9MICO|nr:glycosyltransferase involved in cell wall biosynthesis [Humibacillus xanthopallidus]